MSKVHIVKAGDTLSSVALAHGTRVEVLLALNPDIGNPDRILSGATLRLPVETPDRACARFAWMPIAWGELGVSETPGPEANPRIQAYLATTGLPEAARQSDETPWCAAFVNWCVTRSGGKGTGSAWALAWRTWGVPAGRAVAGSIAVFSRRGAHGEGGHVGFVVEDLGSAVRLLGGNQGNRVSVVDYPKEGRIGRTDYRLLDCRILPD